MKNIYYWLFLLLIITSCSEDKEKYFVLDDYRIIRYSSDLLDWSDDHHYRVEEEIRAAGGIITIHSQNELSTKYGFLELEEPIDFNERFLTVFCVEVSAEKCSEYNLNVLQHKSDVALKLELVNSTYKNENLGLRGASIWYVIELPKIFENHEIKSSVRKVKRDFKDFNMSELLGGYEGELQSMPDNSRKNIEIVVKDVLYSDLSVVVEILSTPREYACNACVINKVEGSYYICKNKNNAYGYVSWLDSYSGAHDLVKMHYSEMDKSISIYYNSRSQDGGIHDQTHYFFQGMKNGLSN